MLTEVLEEEDQDKAVTVVAVVVVIQVVMVEGLLVVADLTIPEPIKITLQE